MRTLLVLLLSTACEDAITNTGDAGLALRFVAAPDVVLGTIDSGRIRVIGPTSRTLTVTPGTTQTIDGLTPGSYTVALEGLAGGEVETFGVRSGINVVAGSNTSVTVTLTSFVPVLSAPPPDVTAGESVTITFSGVTGAVAYVVEYAPNPTFSGAQQTEVTGTTASVTLSAEGLYYIRVRARNEYGSLGVASTSATVTAGPQIQPLNDYIAFTSNQTGADEVYVVRSTGGQEMQLTTTGEGVPDISPDGRRIAYQAAGQRIAVMNADGSGSTTLPGSGCHPDWSPDGTQIVFAEFCTQGPINISNADGSNRRSVTSVGTGYEDSYPRWSPDGSRIVFQSNRTGNRRIWIINADGSDLQQLTGSQGEDAFPAFSPDGTKISWEHTENGQSDFWTMHPDGSWKTQVTNDPDSDGRPDWAPGREWLVVLRGGELWTYRPDGSGATRITDTGLTASNSIQRWGPCLDSSCAPTTGQIEATVFTTGAGVDADGYTLNVDGASGRTVNGTELTTFVAISPGTHVLSISGLAPNCTLVGAASHSMAVTAGQLSQPPSFEVDCTQNVANSIVVTPSTLNLGYVGATMVIYGTPFDGNGDPVPGFTQIFFNSTNPGVVNVDSNGRITASAPGTATININDNSGRTGSMQVTVSADFGPVTYSGGHAYAATKTKFSWGNAQGLARSNGGYLVSINNLQENGFLSNVFYAALNSSFWIGLYDFFVEDLFEWTDASPTSPGATTPGNGFASWQPNEPNGVDEDCVEFGGGQWNDLPCTNELLGVAEWPVVGPTVFENVAYRDGHRYALTRDALTWTEARNLAESLGGHLVVINDAAENQFLGGQFNVATGVNLWLGFTDRLTEGTFTWVGGAQTGFTAWAPGEPNDTAPGEDCAETWDVANGSMLWNDRPCEAKLKAIIEWDNLK